VLDAADERLPFITAALPADLPAQHLQDGDIVFADAAEDSTVGKATEIRGIANTPVVAGLHTIVARPTVPLGHSFLGYYVNSPAFRSRLLPLMQGVKVLSLSRTNLNKTIANLPASADEQAKIGRLLQVLDDIIALQKRKSSALELLRRALLQRLFARVGSNPILRFNGHDSPWRLRRLGEVTARVQGNDGRMDLATLTISAGNGWLDQRDRFSNNIAGNEQQNYTQLRQGELSYNKGNSKHAKCGVVYVLDCHVEALVPRVYHSFRPTDDADAKFLEYLFASKIPDDELAKLITSGARMDGLLNIGYAAFSGIEVNIPELVEQTEISKFMEFLSLAIKGSNTRIEYFEKVKQFLLQQMFI
jgi:type I restriction enzyme S subunit